MAAPSVEEVTRLQLRTNLTSLCSWAGMDNGLQDRWAGLLGFPGGKVGALHPRVLAALPHDVYLNVLANWKVGDAEASFFDKSLAMLVHATAVALCKPEEKAPEAVAEVVAKVEKKTEVRKIKVSNLIDPSDETEVPAASSDQLKIWYENYKALKHGEPLIEKEPSPDQVAALHLRVVTLAMEPYADFSLLTPYGRRVAKTLRHRSWIMQEDGSYRPMEVPGPENFEVWNACFKVYEVILLMLRFPGDAEKHTGETLVVTPSAIEAYHEAFGALVREHPECWHLCQRAEDRCRAEHFPRLARKISEDKGRDATWSEVFKAAAEDDRYWDREVRRPALTFLARGRRGAVPDGGEMAEKRAADGSRKKRQRSKQRSVDTAGRYERPAGGDKKKFKRGGDKSRPEDRKKEDHPRKDRDGRFVTTREGKQICFSFANGERDACRDPCSRGMTHVCQHCLQPHSNAACPKRG
jgi:hypothetical protein